MWLNFCFSGTKYFGLCHFHTIMWCDWHPGKFILVMRVDKNEGNAYLCKTRIIGGQDLII